MRLQVSFTLQNPEFDNEYAKEYHEGKESENNQKNLWSEVFKHVGDLDKIAFVSKADLNLTVTSAEGEQIELCFPNMSILECYSKGNIVSRYAVSKALVNNTRKEHKETYDSTWFYFYFKPGKIYGKITDGVYVIEEDISEKLKKGTLK